MKNSLAPIIGLTFLAQIAAFVLGLTNNILLSRWLGPEMLGVLATILVIIETVNRFANPGMDISALYYLSNQQYPRARTIGNLLVNGVFIFIIGGLCIFLLVETDFLMSLFRGQELSGAFTEHWVAILLLFTYLSYEFGAKISLGLQLFNRYNRLLIMRPLLLLVSLASLYLADRISLTTILVAFALSWLIPGIIHWKQASPFSPTWDRTITVSSLKYGLKVMLANALTFLNYRADIFLIGYFLGPKHVGWYYVSVIVAEKLLFLSQSTSTILFPAGSKSEEEQRKTPILTRMNLLVITLLALILAVSSVWLIPFAFSSEYVNSIGPLIALLPGILALSVTKLIAADFSAKGLPQKSLYASLANFIINILLNVVLIPKLGILGAALSSTVSYSVAAGFLCYLYSRHTNIGFKEMLVPRLSDLKGLTKI